MNSPELNTCSQKNDDGVELSVAGEAESSACYLYFLVCAAESGPLAGLIKVGIADHFPMRYRQHTATWGLFDLSRSVLLRVRNRREAKKLEQALRNHFGDPFAEGMARASGKTLTSEDFIAMGSWRRYPGSRDDGYTEFYAFACLVRMLSYVEDWRTASDERRTGTRLLRGISPLECPTRVRVAEPSLTLGEKRELREGGSAATGQAAGKMRAASRSLMSHAFGFAMAYQELVVHVDLQSWRAARATRNVAYGRNGLVCIYFRPVEFVSAENYHHLEPWLESQAALRQSFAANATLADSLNLTGAIQQSAADGYREEIYPVRPEVCGHIRHLPYLHGTELMCACLGNVYSNAFDPVFELYEMLEKRVESHRAWIEPEFRW